MTQLVDFKYFIHNNENEYNEYALEETIAQLVHFDLSFIYIDEEQLKTEIAHIFTVLYNIAISNGEVPFENIGPYPGYVDPNIVQTVFVELDKNIAKYL